MPGCARVQLGGAGGEPQALRERCLPCPALRFPASPSPQSMPVTNPVLAFSLFLAHLVPGRWPKAEPIVGGQPLLVGEH